MTTINNFKRKKEPLENRQLILEAATDIIIQKGIDSMSLDAVAKKAKLSKGGLMHHFPKKEALIDQLFNDRLLEFTQAFKQELATSRSPVIAFLKTVVNEELDEYKKRSLKVVAQACFSNEHYGQLLSRWYKDHVTADPNEVSPVDLVVFLVAESILISHVSGIYQISKAQKQLLVNYLERLENESGNPNN